MREVIYVPQREKFNVRFRYTRYGLFYFLRSVWRMEVNGTLLQKIAFALAVQLFVLGLPALVADTITLVTVAIGFIVAEIYNAFLRPVAQKVIFVLIETTGKVIAWIAVIIAVLLIFWYYPEIRELAEKILGK